MKHFGLVFGVLAAACAAQVVPRVLAGMWHKVALQEQVLRLVPLLLLATCSLQTSSRAAQMMDGSREQTIPHRVTEDVARSCGLL